VLLTVLVAVMPPGSAKSESVCPLADADRTKAKKMSVTVTPRKGRSVRPILVTDGHCAVLSLSVTVSLIFPNHDHPIDKT
jgi:hypothetical protein